MPIFVDPRTGQRYENDADDAEQRAAEFGFVSPEQYEQTRAAEAEGQLKSGARVAAQTLLAIPEAIQKIDPFQPKPEELSPDAQSYLQGQEASLKEFAGKAKGAAEAYPVTGMAAAALPAVGAGIAAAPLATGALGTLATEAAVGATLGEAGAAATEGREVSAKGALYNGVLGAGFAGLGLGLGAAYRAVSGRVVEPLMQATEKAVQRRIPRALARGGEELVDPEVAARAGEVVGQRIDATMSRIDEAITNARPPVANNPGAQRAAMQGLADQMREAQPELASRLEELMGKSRQERFRGLLDLGSDNPSVNAAIDQLRTDPALWGERAVAHGQALAGARAARPGGPGAYLDALQAFDDPAIRKLAANLSERLDERGGIEAAQAFREARSVGAAGNGPELMPASEVAHYVKNDDKIVDNLRTMAGGGEGEKGAFQDFVESFRKVTANRIKRNDFRAFAPELSEETRAALHAERDAIVDGVPEVVEALTNRGAKKAAGRVTELATELSKADTGEIAPLLDQLKQQYDDINIRAVRDPNDPLHNLKETIDPNVERIRAALENPEYVGEKIAELQQVRNAAWSDRETGFIHNMKVANELGPRIFKKIDVDYHTGDLVMQFDPGAFKQLLNLDWHESKPVLEAWAKALDSAERMAANTTEVGAQSAARGPIGQLQTSIGKLRQIFEVQSKRFIAKDIAQGGLDALSVAEQLPVVGKFVQAGRKFSGGRLEGAIAGARAQYVPVPTRSAAAAAEELGAAGGPVRRAPVGREPNPPVPEPPEPGAPAAAVPVGEMRQTSVGANDAAESIREAAAARQRQAGAVVVQGEATPRIDKLSTKVRDAVEKYRALEKRGVEEGRLADAQAAVDSRLHDLRDEYESRIASLLDGRSPEELGPIARAKYTRLTNGLGELEGVLGQHGGKVEKVGNAELYSIDNPVQAAESWLKGRQTVDTEAGAVYVNGRLKSDPSTALLKERMLASDAGSAVFGDISELDLEKLFGVGRLTHDAIPDVEQLAFNPKTGHAEVQVTFPGENGGADLQRTFDYSPNKINDDWNRFYVSHDRFFLPDADKGRKLATKYFQDMAPVYERMGVQRVNIPELAADGVVVWPQMGFRPGSGVLGTPSFAEVQIMKAAAEAGIQADSLRALAKSQEGQDLLRKIYKKEPGWFRGWNARPQDIIDIVGRPAEGHVVSGMRPGDILASPLGIVTGAGALGLGGYKAYQLSQPTPEQAQRDTALQLLQQHADQDLEETARALTDPDYAERWTRQSAELPGTLESFQGLHRTLGQAYQERRQAIERAAADPNYLIDHAAEAFGDLPPEVALKGFEIAQYLAKELPPKRGVTITRPNGLPPDPLEVRSWALKYQTATDPSSAFDDAKRGTLRHEQVQTLKQIWPERYDQLRTMTLLAMGNGKSTVNQRMRADLLFGFGSALDPAFSRRLSAAARPAYEARAKASGGSPGGAVQSRMPAAMTPGGIGALQLGASAPMGQ